jgi:hypothetical protein
MDFCSMPAAPGWRKRLKNTDDSWPVFLMQAFDIKPGRKASIAAAQV